MTLPMGRELVVGNTAMARSVPQCFHLGGPWNVFLDRMLLLLGIIHLWIIRLPARSKLPRKKSLEVYQLIWTTKWTKCRNL